MSRDLVIFHALEAADVVTEDLCALSLVHQVLRQQLQLHDHVGKPGGDLLLQKMERTLKCKKNDHNPDFILGVLTMLSFVFPCSNKCLIDMGAGLYLKNWTEQNECRSS